MRTASSPNASTAATSSLPSRTDFQTIADVIAALRKLTEAPVEIADLLEFEE